MFRTQSDTMLDEIEEHWEGCCEDPVDDAYYDRKPQEEQDEDHR